MSKVFCISLDFELKWGVRHLDPVAIEAYKDNILGASRAVRALLDVMEKNQIKATWATVGALALENWSEFSDYMSLDKLNTISGFEIDKRNLEEDPLELYFSYDLVNLLSQSNSVELASHTFSHLFCQEDFVTEQDFVTDGILTRDIFTNKFGVTPKTIIYPRNQVAYTDCLSSFDVQYYRDVEPGDKAIHNTIGGNSIYSRATRFIRSFNPLHIASQNLNESSSVASMFVRFNAPSWMWNLQLARISRELKLLADGECFHIWFHPHNLGKNLELSMHRFSQILEIYSRSKHEYGVKNLCVSEACEA